MKLPEYTVVIPEDAPLFTRMVEDAFKDKVICDRTALEQFIQSRERRAFYAAYEKAFHKGVTAGAYSEQADFDDYQASEEYEK